MCTSLVARHLLRKFESFGLCYVYNCLRYRNFIVSNWHSLRESKCTRAVRRINQQKNKSSKLAKKVCFEPEIYMRDTITKICNILRYSTWDSAQEQLERLPIKWDSFTVNKVLKTHPPMEKSWLFFNWASKLKGFKHDQFTYTTMLDIFGEARRISSMKYVFQQMQAKGIKIDAVTYTSLMHWLSNDGDIEGAINLWQEMVAKGCRPTIVSYTAYMKILFHHKRVEEGIEVYKEMLKMGLSPNCFTYTVLMDHLATSGKFKEVVEIFSKMQVAGVEPDKATCNILVEKCCKAGEIEVMMKVLGYMREKCLVLRHPIYLKALETLRTAGESDVLLRQVNRHLSQEKFDNNVHTFIHDSLSAVSRGLILHLMSKQSFIAIDCLLQDLIDKVIKLDPGVISMIIEINCSRCRQDGALLAFGYSVKLGIIVDRTAYLALLGALIRTNSFQKVVDVVQEMIRTGVSLGTYQSALLVYRLGSTRGLVSAVEVFWLLPNEEKNAATYTALIAAYFLSGEAEKGLETFEMMRNQGIKVALGTYCVLLTGLQKTGRVQEWEAYRKEKKNLQAKGCFQNDLMEEKICNLLFSGLSWSSMKRKGRENSREMNLVMSETIYWKREPPPLLTKSEDTCSLHFQDEIIDCHRSRKNP